MADAKFDNFVIELFGIDPAEFVSTAARQASPIANAPGHDRANAEEPGGTGSTDAETWTLHTLKIEPADASSPAGGQIQFTALGLYGGGDAQDETDALDWVSSDPAMVTFDANKRGLAYLSHNQGAVVITAIEPNSRATGSTKLTVAAPLQSEMSEEDRAETEAETRKPAKKPDAYERLFAIGEQDGAFGRPSREGIAWELTISERDVQQSKAESTYKSGYAKGVDSRLATAVSSLPSHGSKGAELLKQAYSAGYSFAATGGSEGFGNQRDFYSIPQKGSDLDPKTVLKAYDAGLADGAKNPVPKTKDEAYAMGKSDGALNDHYHQVRVFEAFGEDSKDLIKAYDAGFRHGKEMSDQAWDEAGAKVDAQLLSSPKSQPLMSTYDKVMTGAGVVATLISVLEAKGLIAKAGIGTALSVALLIPMGFKIGSDIGIAREEKAEAIKTFKSQFASQVFLGALNRARALLDNTKKPLKELNNEGLARMEKLYRDSGATVSAELQKQLDRSPSEQVFSDLYDGWVKKYSNECADLLVNPRLQQ